MTFLLCNCKPSGQKYLKTSIPNTRFWLLLKLPLSWWKNDVLFGCRYRSFSGGPLYNIYKEEDTVAALGALWRTTLRQETPEYRIRKRRTQWTKQQTFPPLHQLSNKTSTLPILTSMGSSRLTPTSWKTPQSNFQRFYHPHLVENVWGEGASISDHY